MMYEIGDVHGEMKMDQRPESAVSGAEAPAAPARKPYSAPVLVTYGGIREITKQNGPNTRKDGGSNGLGSRT